MTYTARRLRVLVFVAIATTAAFLCVAIMPREPSWEGMTLAQWLQTGYGTGMTHMEDDRERADRAMRQMGTRTLPYLVRELGAKHSTLKWRLSNLTRNCGLLHIRYMYADERRERAVAAFQALGSIATPVSPRLRDYLSDPELQKHAQEALDAIEGRRQSQMDTE